MLTLLASLLGFATSALPKLLHLYQDKQDRKHELAILDRQLEQQRLDHSQRLEEIQVQSDTLERQALYHYDNHNTRIAWVEALRASVRPIVTYLFVALFLVVKISALVALLQQGLPLTESLQSIWDDNAQALFAAIMSFWFGHRAFEK